MGKDFDFSDGKRGAVLPSTGKTRITIMLDDDILAHFRTEAERNGIGYQTRINAVLRESMTAEKPVTASLLRSVLREELRSERNAA